MVLPKYGQVVIGPPGSGKTTYCDGMSQLLNSLGRTCAVVNIDPANEKTPFKPDIDVQELVKLEDVMEETGLGPNGGLVYCMEFLEKNYEWLSSRLSKLPKDAYVLIDCPGQVELYTHNDCVKNILRRMEKSDMRLCAVNLVDSHHCSDPAKFISVCLVTLNSMLQMELPQVNVLSKVDLIEKYGRLHFGVDFYTEVLDLKYLTQAMTEDPFLAKHKKMNEAITDLIENYGLVSVLGSE